VMHLALCVMYHIFTFYTLLFTLPLMRFLMLLLICGLAACQSKQNATPEKVAEKPETAAETAVKPDKMTEKAPEAPKAPEVTAVKTGKSCYLRTENTVDSTFVNLDIKADGTVTGTYDWYPYEKDGAYGTLTGKLAGNEIIALYDYTIEGSEQKEEKKFRINNTNLEEFNGELINKKGILVLKDATKGTYDQSFSPVDCAVKDKSLNIRSGGIM
jgi:hypothetical protein